MLESVLWFARARAKYYPPDRIVDASFRPSPRGMEFSFNYGLLSWVTVFWQDGGKQPFRCVTLNAVECTRARFDVCSSWFLISSLDFNSSLSVFHLNISFVHFSIWSNLIYPFCRRKLRLLKLNAVSVSKKVCRRYSILWLITKYNIPFLRTSQK